MGALDSWVKNLRAVRAAGADMLLVKVSGDAAYYNLGQPRDVKVNFGAISKMDSIGKAVTYGGKPEIVIPSLEASKTNIQLLPELLNIDMAVAIRALDGVILTIASGGALCRWTLKSTGPFDDFRMIEYTFGGNFKPSELASLYGNTPTTLGTPATTDALTGLAQTNTPANRVANGLKKVEFRIKGDTAYQDLGTFEKGSFAFTCVGPLGMGGREQPQVTAINFKMDVLGLQQSLVELGLVDDFNANDIDLQLTCLGDDMTINLPAENVASVMSIKNEGNANDKWRTLDIHSEGNFIADSTGAVFQTLEGTPTVWSDMFG